MQSSLTRRRVDFHLFLKLIEIIFESPLSDQDESEFFRQFFKRRKVNLETQYLAEEKLSGPSLQL